MLDLLASPWALVALFVLFAYTTEAMTGFGSIVIALSLSALVLPLDVLMPVLVPLNLVLSGYLTLRYHRLVDWRLLLTGILPMMAAGTLAGFLARPWLDQGIARPLFGALVVAFSVRELWRLRHATTVAAHGPWWSRFWMLMAGLTHGLFASGGPLLVYALNGIRLDKGRFRATLVLVWFSLNGLLTLGFLISGDLARQGGHLLALVPVVLLGIVLGEALHHRVDERRFRQVLFTVLLLAGVALLAR
ncbi:hypothetical protein ASALC70_02594 [Alcanivorax sp. ALC70]|nr:hypothetical protein ASALC70_02594 [Alcanivorax sp. ALC70]